MTPRLDDLIEMASRAGEIIRKGYDQRHQIQYKDEFDVVTEIDHQSENAILEIIQSRFADDYILTEESGTLGSERSRVWYIDPLDGTINFAHNIPYFGVSIAYAADGVLQYGVICQPLLDELFSAERGKGAWLNGRPIHVSSAQRLNQTILVNEYSHLDEMIRLNHADVRYLNARVQGIRRPGSCTVDLCYVAAGRYEGFWTHHAHPWDFAAGGLIVQEAGGTVTNLSGGKDFLTPPCSILAASTNLHPQLLEMLQESTRLASAA
jgi:myo-inositol-1(or 4)-monophosphatase